MLISRRAAVAYAVTIPTALVVGARPTRAASAQALASEGEAALRRLYVAQPHTRTLGGRARAILVFPRIVKVGVLLAGGQTGDGVLLVRNRPAGYFNLSAASFGPQAGGQTFAYALFFMNDASLTYLDKSDGWDVGTGPSIVVVDRSAAASLTAATISQDVYAVPFDAKGLMAGIGIEGSKITRIKPSA